MGRPIPLFVVWFLIIAGLAIIGTAAWQLWGPVIDRSITNGVIGMILGAACTGLATLELVQRGGREIG